MKETIWVRDTPVKPTDIVLRNATATPTTIVTRPATAKFNTRPSHFLDDIHKVEWLLRAINELVVSLN